MRLNSLSALGATPATDLDAEPDPKRNPKASCEETDQEVKDVIRSGSDCHHVLLAVLATLSGVLFGHV
jgi:hypothetical protein